MVASERLDLATYRERVTGRPYKESTVDEYCTWIRDFAEWHDGGDITDGVLMDFDAALEAPADYSFLRDDPYAYSTRRKAISAVGNWARVMREARFHTDDLTDLVRGEPESFDPTILDRDTIADIQAQECSIPGCRAARVVGYEAIMRRAEVAWARPEDVTPDEGTIYVRAAKNSEARHIGISESTMALLTEQLARINDEFKRPRKLFYNSYRGGWTKNAWGKHFSRKHHEAGFHSYARHSAIVHRLEDGEDFWNVFLRARHRHVNMTGRYASIAGRTVPAMERPPER